MNMQNETTQAPNHKELRHYWLREDFDELIGVIPGADVPLPGDKDSSSSLVYPKSTKGAVAELKLRGIDCNGAMLQRLADDGIVKPECGTSVVTDDEGDIKTEASSRILYWGSQDIDAAAEYLYNEGCWGRWTHFCWVANLRFGQAVKAHRVTCVNHGLGFHLSFDIPGFVTLIEPAEDATADFARIRFYPNGTKLVPQEASQ